MSEKYSSFARVPERRFRRAEKVLQKLKLNAGDDVNMLLAQIEIRQGSPFEVTTHSRPLLSATEQAAHWNASFGRVEDALRDLLEL
jgi:antitoxin component of RelBE/YafQ-DinJ toxin-antitoxin module